MSSRPEVATSSSMSYISPGCRLSPSAGDGAPEDFSGSHPRVCSKELSLPSPLARLSQKRARTASGTRSPDGLHLGQQTFGTQAIVHPPGCRDQYVLPLV